MKGQMRHADRLGAGHTLILDADGSTQLRDMRSGQQREVAAARVVEELSTG
jgi:histidyl-tRNA synthetase